MSISISSLTSSLSSLSFSSQISQKPNTLSFSKSLSLCNSKPSPLRVSATVAEPQTADLKKLVKSRLPGGFAAQPIFGTGRRKCAIARVVLQEGTGKVIINYRDAKEYLQGNPLWLQYVKVPLVTLGYENSYDVFVKAHGGGLSGQAQAISLGVARALLKVSDSHRPPLKKEGLLTRDSRVVERKKVGLKKARKAPQFSKR
ncbi:30S ribosomal protein S9, chloroplastic [Ricinus communis]|uniref:Small ribosomal subunit protein uS9c n=1 Tax=Ricinus communis TaxID=3988 RepID=B9R7N5_RICCO|nr:30S ribosomal protein S9, chloroplastic [Ricinus communis]EEF52515.1 ribosomal protein S9, putative [Ricinus communis]|eukprot:XP_002510328.1 30S ribosomal protein S9, chloroplastic [Ricinus communis]